MTMQVTYIGCDGSTWDLIHGPVHLDHRGVEGLGNPVWNRQTIESSGTDGQRRTGQRSRAKARDGYLPVTISAATPGEWYALSAAWWDAWSPDQEGQLQVTVNGHTRTLGVCIKDDDTYAPPLDPTLLGVEVVGVHWVADQPFWLGADQHTVDLDELGETGGSGSLFNYGDLDAWPVYHMDGPFTSFHVTVGSHIVSGTVTVPTGATLVLDTDPARQTAFLYVGGVATNVTPKLTAVDFAPIGSGTSATVTGTVAGGDGEVVAKFYPRYHRAW